MSIVALRNDLLERIAGFQDHPEFKLRRSQRKLVRALEGAKHFVQFATINHGADFDVVVNFSIRFDAAEDLFNRGNPHIPKAEKPRTATLGCELGNYLGEGQKRWSIQAESDLEPVARSIAAAVSEHVLPFFACYEDGYKALELLMRLDEDAHKYAPIPSVRAARAVALASVLEGADIRSVISHMALSDDTKHEPARQLLG